MKATDLKRIRTGRLTAWRPDMECADCLGPPSCPELTDELWRWLWGSREPAAPRRCNCDRWSGFSRLTHRVPVGPDMHWHLCDLARPLRRQLLCLECAERRLGRRISVEDLKPCLGNYHVAVESVRHGLTLLAVAREEFRTSRGRDPVDVPDLDAVDARARALASGRCDDRRISPALTSVESQLVAAARGALRELGPTVPDWSKAHVCVKRQAEGEEFSLEVSVGGQDYEVPWPTLAPCDDLDEFFDGELTSTQRADAFRSHLPTCERCSRVLEGRMHELVAVSATDDEARRALGSLRRDCSTARPVVVDALIAEAGLFPWMEYTAADLDAAIARLRQRRRVLPDPPAPGELVRLDGPTLNWLRAIVVAHTADDPEPSQTRADALELIDRLYARVISVEDDPST